MTEVRVGFIGAGGIASRHLGNLLGFGDVKVVVFADPDETKAREQAARCGAKTYADYREMLDEESLDALYICVPPFAHGPLELAAVEQGLPFFVEKPLAVDFETAERVARAVERASLVTAVGYHWRYLDTVEEAQARLAETPARLVQGYWLDATPPPAWWHQDELSGGQMVEQTTHIFDLARLLVGEVVEVYALGGRVNRPEFPDLDVFDVSVASLRFASGAVGTVASTCLLGWPHRVGLHLFGDRLAVELSEHELMVDVGRGRPVRPAEGDPFVREDRAFINAVKGEVNCICAPYEEALKTHRLVTAAARSAKECRPLHLDEASEAELLEAEPLEAGPSKVGAAHV